MTHNVKIIDQAHEQKNAHISNSEIKHILNVLPHISRLSVLRRLVDKMFAVSIYILKANATYAPNYYDRLAKIKTEAHSLDNHWIFDN